MDQVTAANVHFSGLTAFERYFANLDEQTFLTTCFETRDSIIDDYAQIGLSEAEVEALREFCENFDSCARKRKDYNDEFVRREQEKYADFFVKLEAYPLSNDQTEAIIRDEDNNLVLAGAGTGKTTTISGKVAYLLEKGLAQPEELLIISFTNNAAREMQERCAKFCGHIPEAANLDVRTFNSFGFLVCRSCSSEEIRVGFDDHDQAKKFLQEKFNELFKHDPSFQRKATNYLAFFSRVEKEEADFATKNDFFNYEQELKNIGLDGRKYKSQQEMYIANFFCLFNINYAYEKHYPLEPEDRNPTYGVYQPDFYLTDYQIWHEHYGIDRNGDVAKGVKRDQYHAGMTWKDSIHEKYKTRLIKSFSYEASEGCLIRNLKQRLLTEGVEMKERDPEEILELLEKSEDYQDFMNLIYVFLTLMKSCGKSPGDLEPDKGDQRSRVFLDVIEPLYQAYDHHLKSISAVDFNDMINHAAQHFYNGKYTKPYKYILVDEFQDMSIGRYQLLQAIRVQNPGVKLYAVGDDWQSIYRFTGSDLSIITQFEKHFGVTCQTAILKTYRFNDQILQTSSAFVQKNPAQLRKQLTAQLPTPEGHTSFAFLPYKSGIERKNRLVEILDKIHALQPNASVFLIGRYKASMPKNVKHSGLNIQFFTAHGVKGMTCDYAILLDINSGTLGFPSEMADDPILNYLLQEKDHFENAEERRVFYVAITRARHKNYLLYHANQPSKFITELQEATNTNIRCPECNGRMIRRTGPYSEFYGCVHYPKCTGKVPLSLSTELCT